MTTTTTQLLTAEEFYEFVHRPENQGKHFELERGRVVEMSRPGERHGVVTANVVRILGNYTFERGQGYVCANDTGVVWERNPDTVRGPDIIYSDQNREFDDLNPKYAEQVPKLAVEVLSPNDRPGKVNARVARFLEWGVALVWLVDPEERTVTVYRPDRGHKVLTADQELTSDDILPGFRCRVADFFWMPGTKKTA